MKAKTKITGTKNIMGNESEVDFIQKLIQGVKLNLELAGIFFINSMLQIKEGEKKFKKLEIEIKSYNKIFKKRSVKYPINTEEFITFQLHKLRDIEVLYEPVVRHFATSKILLVCCAETFINEVAAFSLRGKSLEEFEDKPSISGKWIFLQELMKFKKS